MKTIVDMTGERFGRLVVLGLEEVRGRNGRTNAMWRCRCDCGKEVVAYRMNLTRGNTTSCGCYSRERHSQMLRDMWAMWKEAKKDDHDAAAAPSAGAAGKEAR